MTPRLTRAAALACALGCGAALAAQDRRPAGDPAAAAAGRRLALVIGNDSYTDEAVLANARNDARGVAAKLRGLGFDVTAVEDGTRARMLDAVITFQRRLTTRDLAVIFYAGHGQRTESDGVNYLIPVEYRGTSEEELRAYAVSSHELTSALRRARVGVLVLDACRNNPYGGQRSGGQGLAPPPAVPGLLIAYAAAAGQTAGDAPGAANSPYTSELLQVLGTPGYSLVQTFTEVGRRVRAKTGNRQSPALYLELNDDVVLSPGATAAPAPLTLAPARDVALEAELALWEAIRDSGSAAAFEDYLKRYPAGQFRVPAEERLRAARAAAAGDGARPATGGNAAPAGGMNTASTMGGSGAARRAGETRPDARFPALSWAYIPAGTFQMGCVPGDTQCNADESPRHAVTLSRPYELMTTEATLGMWRASGVPLPVQPDWNTGDTRPAVHVTWDEAVAFCRAVGGRLPTEAEWERAARGGAEGWTYVWGDTGTPVVNGQRMANVADETFRRKYPGWTIFAGYDDGYAETSPVGTFPANAYGLHDMAGNVFELLADWYGGYGRGAVRDPRGSTSGSSRVVRGGSWNLNPRSLRVSDRDLIAPSYRSVNVGVRCARDVFP